MQSITPESSPLNFDHNHGWLLGMDTCSCCGGDIPASYFKTDKRVCLGCAEEQALALRLAGDVVEQERYRIPRNAYSVVWKFSGAHKYLQNLSSRGGDEDWIALVFDEVDWAPPWVMALGACDIQEVRLLNGWTVFIGSHA